ncbi:hypothetical protein EXIGLDRAFT_729717 [Exidia glandulosa HHB12029]|uniref:Uncharacterized protein n=1 Tax=Exidia glandulosa HHB12029 TaxID=1314781 RepID=A0A165CH41_EXIGL|nr:hypothetical protein EXIGLDRAFT_729717 [Exidia glandulosa HHB12029]
MASIAGLSCCLRLPVTLVAPSNLAKGVNEESPCALICYLLPMSACALNMVATWFLPSRIPASFSSRSSRFRGSHDSQPSSSASQSACRVETGVLRGRYIARYSSQRSQGVNRVHRR